MKKLVLIVCALLLINCSNDDAENVIDCLFVGADFHVNHTVDGSNEKLVMFTVTYDGEHTLDSSIKWDFGDGTVETLPGTTVTHEYSAAGNYTVKIRPNAREGSAFCTPELTENVVVN